MEFFLIRGPSMTRMKSRRRRLAYVGLTRAEHRLYLTRAESRSSWGPPNYNPPSRFLDEIPPSVIDWRNKPVSSVSTRRYASAISPAARPTGKKNVSMELAVGERVSHDTFGLGKVVSLDGQGENMAATIDFGAVGQKRLLLRYAPVEKL